MKRSFIFVICAVLCMAACQKVEQAEQVVFEVNLPGELDTRSISEGEKAVKLFYATYTDKNVMIPSLSNINQGVVISGKKAKINLRLVKDLEYSIVFWAQSNDCKAFSFDWSKALMKVDYDGNANDDYRDAFYAVCQDVVVNSSDFPHTVMLNRPFAQINFGASDYGYVTDYFSTSSVDSKMTSSLISAEVPNELNLLDGTLGKSVASLDLSHAAIPNDPRLLKVDDKEYKYVSMNYVLAPKGTEPAMLSSVTANFKYESVNRTVKVENVPYLRNHRTNIIGNFFTEKCSIDIVIVEAFDKPDFNKGI